MASNQKKKNQKDPIFTVCLVIFLFAAMGVIGVYINDHYIFNDDTQVTYGDKVTLNYTGSYYDYIGNKNAVVFDTTYHNVADNDSITKSNDFMKSDKYNEIDIVVGKGNMLQAFEESMLGHKVGDKFRVKIPNGYDESLCHVNASKYGASMPTIQTMNRTIFEQIYDDVELTNSASQSIKTIYGWNAIVIQSSTNNDVIIINMPNVGETYTYDESNKNFGEIQLKVTSVGNSIIFDYIFSEYNIVEGCMIQMIRFYMGEHTIYITDVYADSFSYKTCCERSGMDLYFEVEVMSIR